MARNRKIQSEQPAAPKKHRRKLKAAIEAEEAPLKEAKAPRRRRSRGRSDETTKRLGNTRRSSSIPPAIEAKKTRGERASALRARVQRIRERLRRPVYLISRGILVIAVVVGTVAVARLVNKHVRTSDSFALKHLEIESGERVSESDVLETLGVAEGSNIFDVSPEEAQARLQKLPWVREVSVTRRLPSSMHVEIEERRAVALLSLGTELMLVADDGAVFKSIEPGDPIDMPLVTGVDEERFKTDQNWRTSVLLEVVALLHDYRGVGLWRREPISEVRAASEGGLELVIGEDGTYVRLGEGPFRDKLKKLRRVLDRLKESRERAEYIYLDNVRRTDRVTVRVRDLPEPPPSEPEEQSASTTASTSAPTAGATSSTTG